MSAHCFSQTYLPGWVSLDRMQGGRRRVVHHTVTGERRAGSLQPRRKE